MTSISITVLKAHKAPGYETGISHNQCLRNKLHILGKSI